jgi:hypothetical protein
MAQIIYSTIRTTKSFLKETLKTREEGESIRFWKEKSGGWWSSESYSLWRIYAATFYGSKATMRQEKFDISSDLKRRVGEYYRTSNCQEFMGKIELYRFCNYSHFDHNGRTSSVRENHVSQGDSV